MQWKRILTLQCQRVSLTTDTWTSFQNINYMFHNAHFVDADLMLHKCILCFHEVPNPKERTIRKVIESCLHEFGIERVFTIIVDNAISNDVATSHLKKKSKSWCNGVGCFLDGEFLHMRCYAHIINMILSQRLKEAHNSIVSICNSVRYVRSSLARL